MGIHFRYVAPGSHGHHHGDPFHFHPSVTPLEERRMLSAGSAISHSVMPPSGMTAPAIISAATTHSEQSGASGTTFSASPPTSHATPTAMADPATIDKALASSDSPGAPQIAVLSAAGSSLSQGQSTTAPTDNGPGGPSVIAGNPSGSSSSTGANTPSGVIGTTSQPLAAQLQAVKNALSGGAVPTAAGLSAPIPAVVAIFASQMGPATPTAAGPPSAVAITNPPPTTVALTGGDVPPAAAPTTPLSPALPPVSPDLSNDARDQVLQEFARPQAPPPADPRAIDNLLQDMTDPTLPWLNPAPNPRDGSQITPAEPNVVQAWRDDVRPAALGLSLETAPPVKTEFDAASWASLATALAGATIGEAKTERKPTRRPGGVKKVSLHVERLLHA